MKDKKTNSEKLKSALSSSSNFNALKDVTYKEGLQKPDFSKQLDDLKKTFDFVLTNTIKLDDGRIVTLACTVEKKVCNNYGGSDIAVVKEKDSYSFGKYFDFVVQNFNNVFYVKPNNYGVKTGNTTISYSNCEYTHNFSNFNPDIPKTNGFYDLPSLTSSRPKSQVKSQSLNDYELMTRDIVSYSLNFGYSVCMPEDIYDVELGEIIAIGRAKKSTTENRLGVLWNTFITGWGSELNKVMIYGIFEKVCSDFKLKPSKYFNRG